MQAEWKNLPKIVINDIQPSINAKHPTIYNTCQLTPLQKKIMKYIEHPY